MRFHNIDPSKAHSYLRQNAMVAVEPFLEIGNDFVDFGREDLEQIFTTSASGLRVSSQKLDQALSDALRDVGDVRLVAGVRRSVTRRDERRDQDRRQNKNFESHREILFGCNFFFLGEGGDDDDATDDCRDKCQKS